MARPKSRWGTVNVAAAAPSATAEPVSLKTMSGRANCVTELPKFEIVSPTKNFQKSDFSRPPAHFPATMPDARVRDHLACSAHRVTHGAFACAAAP
jgi:hypothetical protein